MRVIVTLTIDGIKEIRVEGDSPFMEGQPGDSLEEKGLGIWLESWRYPDNAGPAHKGRIFIPWGSALCCEEQEVNRAQR